MGSLGGLWRGFHPVGLVDGIDVDLVHKQQRDCFCLFVFVLLNWGPFSLLFKYE